MKRIKMCLYGEPGVGKSVFASKAPKPFFVCTDNNYGWLEDFGADPEAHADVHSWQEMKSVFANTELLSNYETIVVDLLEDAFKWCEQEFCVKNKIDHVSDIGYGKGYDITRNEFFIEISKLIALDKNVILIMHGLTTIVKDRRGVEHTKFVPSSRIPDKVIDMIEGRVRYFLRCYLKGEETSGGVVVKKRYLSLVPKENEFGIIRGVNENLIPHDIPLDWVEFVQAIGFETTHTTESVQTNVSKRGRPKKVDVVEKEPESYAILNPLDPSEPKTDPKKKVETEFVPITKIEPSPIEPKIEQVEKPIVEQPKQSEPTQAEKLAAIKAKLAAMKAAKN